ncbi:MAG: hypothetical protein LBJ00_02165 [Planctomycetaceae bacterium]|nr:hypothetical protein [Planctomycetaceae bacterium]
MNLQRRALSKHYNVKRLFKGEAYRPCWFRCTKIICGRIYDGCCEACL